MQVHIEQAIRCDQECVDGAGVQYHDRVCSWEDSARLITGLCRRTGCSLGVVVLGKYVKDFKWQRQEAGWVLVDARSFLRNRKHGVVSEHLRGVWQAQASMSDKLHCGKHANKTLHALPASTAGVSPSNCPVDHASLETAAWLAAPRLGSTAHTLPALPLAAAVAAPPVQLRRRT